MRSNFDTPWKLILEQFFQPLLEFLFPHIANEIDWEIPFEHLDKELLAIQKEAKIKNKLSDKLIKVYKKSGEESWVIIHIEIQGKNETHFAQRLFQYYYRIYNRYQIPVATLAILTDRSKKWRPNEYHQQLWGCHMSLKFPIIKLIDYISREEMLNQSKNPIAKVVQAHLAALQSKGNATLKFQNKLRLVKNLYSLGYNRAYIQSLYEFIDYALSLPPNQEKEFITTMQVFEKEVNMPYITSAERIGIEKGIQLGIEQGIEQGIEKGIERGIEKGILQGEKMARQKMFLLALNKKFNFAIPSKMLERVEKATSTELELWLNKILEDSFAIEELT